MIFLYHMQLQDTIFANGFLSLPTWIQVLLRKSALFRIGSTQYHLNVNVRQVTAFCLTGKSSGMLRFNTTTYLHYVRFVVIRWGTWQPITSTLGFVCKTEKSFFVNLTLQIHNWSYAINSKFSCFGFLYRHINSIFLWFKLTLLHLEL